MFHQAPPAASYSNLSSRQQTFLPEIHCAQKPEELIDELFLVLYDPREIAKRRINRHFCHQIPMRYRILPKSFFIQNLCSSSNSNSDFYRSSNRSFTSNYSHSNSHPYSNPYQTESTAPSSSTQIIPKNNFHLIQNNISFIENNAGYEMSPRMFASIEVTTLKYQKTLQLPTSHEQGTNASNNSWDQSQAHNSSHNTAQNTANFTPTNPWLEQSLNQRQNFESGTSTTPSVNQTLSLSHDTSSDESNESQSTLRPIDYLDLSGLEQNTEEFHTNTEPETGQNLTLTTNCDPTTGSNFTESSFAQTNQSSFSQYSSNHWNNWN